MDNIIYMNKYICNKCYGDADSTRHCTIAIYDMGNEKCFFKSSDLEERLIKNFKPRYK